MCTTAHSRHDSEPGPCVAFPNPGSQQAAVHASRAAAARTPFRSWHLLGLGPGSPPTHLPRRRLPALPRRRPGRMSLPMPAMARPPPLKISTSPCLGAAVSPTRIPHPEAGLPAASSLCHYSLHSPDCVSTTLPEQQLFTQQAWPGPALTLFWAKRFVNTCPTGTLTRTAPPPRRALTRTRSNPPPWLHH